MTNKLNLFLTGLLCILTVIITSAQTFPLQVYPSGYFRNPLDIPISLSGNFGEIRPGHYHMGLDIRTMARVNLAVRAAADGYVARVKIEPFGFGRAIYINHPNGYTTLYAHLNNFTPELEAYIKQQQYKLESWRIFIDVPPNLFRVKKGDFIAYSGTTGGSQAPHLHFEIRRTADDVNLNPLLFGFPLLDNNKPVILKLAMYDRTKSTYEQTPKLIPVTFSGGVYTTTPLIITSNSPKVSFAINAYDTHNGSNNTLGVYEAYLYDNNREVSGFQIDKISYNDTRYVNAHIDYKTKSAAGGSLQHLNVLPGYLNSVYTKHNGNGFLNLADNAVHAVKIVVKDAYGNTAELRTSIQFKGYTVPAAPLPGKMFYPLMLDVFDGEDCEFYMGENCLYDSAHIGYSRRQLSGPASLSAVHTIGSKYIPVHDSFLVRIKPTQAIPPDKIKFVLMKMFAGRDTAIRKVEWQNGWASARFRDFGSFQLVLDEVSPVIVPIGIRNGANLATASRIAFTIRDNMQTIRNFRAELDGKWLRFTNDKGRTFIYTFDEFCPPGQHSLKISVEDEVGNIAVQTFSFNR